MAPPKAAVLVPLALLAAMAFRGNQVGLWDHLAKNLDAHTLVNDDSLPLFSSFTGIPFLDEVFKALVSFFWSVLGPNASFLHRFFVFDFFVSWLPVVLAMYVEAIRGSNANTLLAFPVPWLLSVQTFTYAFTMPFYAIAAARTAKKYPPTPIKSNQVKALAPAIFFSFIIPTILLFNPYRIFSNKTHQAIVAIWQPFYLGISFLYLVVSRFTPEPTSEAKDLHSSWNHLRLLYRLSGFLSAGTHLAFVGYLIYKRKFLSTYIPNLNERQDQVYNCFLLLLTDYVLGSTSVMLWVWFVVKKEEMPVKARWLLLLTVGPGAAFAVAMRNREKEIVQVAQRQRAIKGDGMDSRND